MKSIPILQALKIGDDVAFFQAVRSQLVKLGSGGGGGGDDGEGELRGLSPAELRQC
ncbi:MAG: hypothetical protein WCO42_11825 [bacterium]